MFNQPKAFEISDDGLVFDGGAHVMSGSASPYGLINAINPSVYYQTTGVLWYHPGAGGVNAWTTDIDFSSVGRVKNMINPVNLGDGVNLKYIKHYGASANAETSTTSTTTYANKISLVTPALDLGDYDVTWSFKWRAANANRGIQLQVTDNTTEIINHIEFIANVNAIPYLTGKKELVGISGIHTLDFNFRVGIGATTVFVSSAHLDLVRVA